MPKLIEIKVPDIGDFNNIPVIEILVSPGDKVNKEDPLITLESDKATMEVPSPEAGVIDTILVNVDEQVSEGTIIAKLSISAEDVALNEVSEPQVKTQESTTSPKENSAPEENSASSSVSSQDSPTSNYEYDLVVIGSGPGGYTAAFRAADLGLHVALIERYPTLGGVCLNVGCIPSKALLHAAKVIEESKNMAGHGVSFGKPEINIDKLRGWKEQVVSQLTAGLKGLSKQRKVTVIHGLARFLDAHSLSIKGANDTQTVSFKNAVIAAGSQPTVIPGFPLHDERVFDSTGALALTEIPERLLVVGGGIIGLEMATVYHALGASVTVVELMDQLIPGSDTDIVRPLHKRLKKQLENIYLKTKVVSMSPDKSGINVVLAGKDAPAQDKFDQVLVAVGRQPNGAKLNATAAGVEVDERGFIHVDRQQRTNVENIFAIGDLVGQPMLAHKAVHEGKVAAEVAAGHQSGFDAKVIPSVAYTDPEVAWVGVTENEAKEQKLDYGKGVFPWAASGRSLSLGRNEGITKLLFDNGTNRVIGAGIVGPNAGDLIAEVALAIEMGCDAEDIGLTIHPHPTLSETVGFAAEAFAGTITDLYMPKKSRLQA